MKDALAYLPDETRISLTIGSGDMTVRELRRAFSATDPHRVLTTGEASELLGYSPDTWREWAPEVPGAYRDDGERAYWRLPYVGCVEHLRRLKARRLKAGRRRGPWKKEAEAKAAQAGGSGAEGVQERKVLRLRPASVGRGQAHHEEPEASRLAP